MIRDPLQSFVHVGNTSKLLVDNTSKLIGRSVHLVSNLIKGLTILQTDLRCYSNRVENEIMLIDGMPVNLLQGAPLFRIACSHAHGDHEHSSWPADPLVRQPSRSADVL